MAGAQAMQAVKTREFADAEKAEKDGKVIACSAKCTFHRCGIVSKSVGSTRQ